MSKRLRMTRVNDDPLSSPFRVHIDGRHIGVAVPNDDGTWLLTHIDDRRMVVYGSLTEAATALAEMDNIYSPRSAP